jgi:hypothetical protein
MFHCNICVINQDRIHQILKLRFFKGEKYKNYCMIRDFVALTPI